MTLARLGQGEGMVDPYLMEGRKMKISRMSGGSLALEPHERLNFLLIAQAWDAAHPRDSPPSPLNCPPRGGRLDTL